MPPASSPQAIDHSRRIVNQLAQLPEVLSIAHQRNPIATLQALTAAVQLMGPTVRGASGFSTTLLHDLRSLASDVGNEDEPELQQSEPDGIGGEDEPDDDFQELSFKLADPDIIITAVQYAANASKAKREPAASKKDSIVKEKDSKHEDRPADIISSPAASEEDSIVKGMDPNGEDLHADIIPSPAASEEETIVKGKDSNDEARPADIIPSSSPGKGKGKSRQTSSIDTTVSRNHGKGKEKAVESLDRNETSAEPDDDRESEGEVEAAMVPTKKMRRKKGGQGRTSGSKAITEAQDLAKGRSPSTSSFVGNIWDKANEDRRSKEQTRAYRFYHSFEHLLPSVLVEKEGAKVATAVQSLKAYMLSQAKAKAAVPSKRVQDTREAAAGSGAPAPKKRAKVGGPSKAITTPATKAPQDGTDERSEGKKGLLAGLHRGNVPKVWHRALCIINDVLSEGPLSPTVLINRAFGPASQLQNNHTRAAPASSPPEEGVVSCVARMEKNFETQQTAALVEVLETIHLFDIERQAKVDAKFDVDVDADRKLDAAKLTLQLKENGLLSRTVAFKALSGGTPLSAQSSPLAIDDAAQSTHDSDRPQKLALINNALRLHIKSGQRWHELGIMLGSITFIPFLLLSPSVQGPHKVRKTLVDEWQALSLLLRGFQPVPEPGRPFTDHDNLVIRAMMFGVRGYLPRVFSHATARAGSLASNSSTGLYADVLVVRDAKEKVSIGNVEPSLMQAPPSVRDPNRSESTLLRPVYGLEIPGSKGKLEIITRTPAFVTESWSTYMSSADHGASVTLAEALAPNPNRNRGLRELKGRWPESFGVDFENVRTCQLLDCKSSDVLPYAAAYAQHYQLDPESTEFKMLCNSIKLNQRQIFPIVPVAQLVDVTDEEAASTTTSNRIELHDAATAAFTNAGASTVLDGDMAPPHSS